MNDEILCPTEKTPHANTVVKESNQSHSTISSTAKPERAQSETTTRPAAPESGTENKSLPEPKEQLTKPALNLDLPRQVRVHSVTTILNQQDTSTVASTTEHANLTLNKEVNDSTTGASVLAHDPKAHVPHAHGLEEKQPIGANSLQTNETKVGPP
jgi:hypothetical protein